MLNFMDVFEGRILKHESQIVKKVFFSEVGTNYLPKVCNQVSKLFQVIEHSCYTFNGAGYAMQRDIRNYDPRYLSVSMEIKSFDPNALIFFAINEYQVKIAKF